MEKERREKNCKCLRKYLDLESSCCIYSLSATKTNGWLLRKKTNVKNYIMLYAILGTKNNNG